MKAGQLRHQVQILQQVVNRDAYGENIQTWEAITTCWASIQQIRGVLLALAQARAATNAATHVITIRAKTGINETHRVQFGDSLGLDFSALKSSQFDMMTSAMFSPMVSNNIGQIPPTIYTITSILDPDTRNRQLNMLCTVVKA